MFRRFMSNITTPSPQNSILFWSISSFVNAESDDAFAVQSYFTSPIIL